MERLSLTQQQQVKKMSDERLRTKLVEYGFDEELVLTWSREELLNSFAETMVPGAKAKEPTVVDPEVERQRLDFEKLKWEQQRDLEQQRIEADKQRAEADRLRAENDKLEREMFVKQEAAKLEFERQKMEAEKEEKEKERELEQQKLNAEKEERELERQKMNAERELEEQKMDE